jgi:hypothetical protein
MPKTRWTKKRLEAVLYAIDDWVEWRRVENMPLPIDGNMLGAGRARLMEELVDRRSAASTEREKT